MTDVINKERYEKRVLNQKESAQCKNLAINYRKKIDKTNPPNSVIWKDLADLADKRTAELQEQESGRSPDIPYHRIGLPTGTILHLPEAGIEAEVYSNRTLRYKGREIHITPLEDELIESGIERKKVKNKWEVKSSGEQLNDVYRKIYPKE